MYAPSRCVPPVPWRGVRRLAAGRGASSADRREGISSCGCHGIGSMRSVGAKSSATRSEEHTSELQSLMRISYAVFCLKKKKSANNKDQTYKRQTIRINEYKVSVKRTLT